jgi:hypothetical protein
MSALIVFQNGRSALHAAAFNGDMEMVSLLLGCGVERGCLDHVILNFKDYFTLKPDIVHAAAVVWTNRVTYRCFER